MCCFRGGAAPEVPRGGFLVRMAAGVEGIRAWLFKGGCAARVVASAPDGVGVVGRMGHGMTAMLRARRLLLDVVNRPVIGARGRGRGYSRGGRVNRLGEDGGVRRGSRRGVVGIRDSKAAQRPGQAKVTTHCGYGMRGREGMGGDSWRDCKNAPSDLGFDVGSDGRPREVSGCQGSASRS